MGRELCRMAEAKVSDGRSRLLMAEAGGRSRLNERPKPVVVSVVVSVVVPDGRSRLRERSITYTH